MSTGQEHPRHPLECCPRHCIHPHHDEPRSMLRCDQLASCPADQQDDLPDSCPDCSSRIINYTMTGRRKYACGRIEGVSGCNAAGHTNTHPCNACERAATERIVKWLRMSGQSSFAAHHAFPSFHVDSIATGERIYCNTPVDIDVVADAIERGEHE